MLVLCVSCVVLRVGNVSAVPTFMCWYCLLCVGTVCQPADRHRDGQLQLRSLVAAMMELQRRRPSQLVRNYIYNKNVCAR